jgi:tetratricopeptide (TPR) repeat protein
VLAALVAALGIMAFHEFFDFNLQIPANAFLFALFLGLALRLTGGGVSSFKSQVPSLKSQVSSPKSQVRSRFQVVVAVGIGVAATALCLLALRQQGLPYPYNLQEPASAVEARELLLSYPAHSSLHRSLFRFLQEQSAPIEDWFKELEIAHWLDPLDPYAHDLYAAGLAEQGRNEEALQEMTRSISSAPILAAHLYLDDEGVALLSEQEGDAVEEGFKQALTSGYERAVDGLGAFYTAVKRFADAGKVYEEAASREEETDARLPYLLKAGLAYVRAEDEGREKAEALFRQAAQLAPQDPRAYQYLAVQVFAPQGDVALVKAVIAEGMQNGADSFSLSLSLAEAAQKAGDRKEARAALQKALALRQFSFEANFRLGLLYLQEKSFDRAVLLLRKAISLRPNAASAFFNLGLAEEGRYQFFEAQKAYARAVELAPDNMSFQARYQAFQHKVAEEKRQ